MATRFAVRHLTSGRYLGVTPSVAFSALQPTAGQVSAVEVQTVEEAATYTTIEEGAWERESLESFKDAWEVVPVEVEMMGDSPSEATIRKREKAAWEQGR